MNMKRTRLFFEEIRHRNLTNAIYHLLDGVVSHMPFCARRVVVFYINLLWIIMPRTLKLVAFMNDC